MKGNLNKFSEREQVTIKLQISHWGDAFGINWMMNIASKSNNLFLLIYKKLIQ